MRPLQPVKVSVLQGSGGASACSRECGIGVAHLLWSPDEITLRVFAVKCRELGELLLRLDAFGDDVAAERARHAGDRAHNGMATLIVKLTHEALIDFQRVECEPVQMAEVGIARAEIVERNTYVC